MTVRGMVAVEALREGDQAITQSGASRRVIWIGHRRIDCRRHPRPQEVLPVRVSTGAFGEGLPKRDLRLSPDHAVFIYGVLIPIKYLINGATIMQEQVTHVDYYHVELPTHDVILAEGLPTESYLDLGNRGAFDNGGDALVLHPDFASAIWSRDACAQLLFGGPVLDAVKQRLLLQAGFLGHATTRDPDLRVRVGRQVLRPERVGTGYRFMLPTGTRVVRLLSRLLVKALVRPDRDEGRTFGIEVAELRLDRQVVGIGDECLGRGWHAADADGGAASGLRWTDGDAYITVNGARELIVRINPDRIYWTEREPIRRTSNRR